MNPGNRSVLPDESLGSPPSLRLVPPLVPPDPANDLQAALDAADLPEAIRQAIAVLLAAAKSVPPLKPTPRRKAKGA